MHETALILTGIGGLLLLGLLTDYLGKHTILPRVTLLLLFGVLVGQEILNIIPPAILNNFDLIANMTLIMIGFLLGGKLNHETLGGKRKQLLSISILTALSTGLFVTLGLLLCGVGPDMAILIGCISSATDPAATMDVDDETGIKNSFANLLLSVVAIDDAWSLILFSIGLTLALSLTGTGDYAAPLLHMLYDIGGALLLGMAIGVPAAYLTGRLCPGRPMLTEALGLVFLCGGVAIWLDVSFLFASMIMGLIVGNFAKHHEYAFHEIENVEWPFMIIFFVLAGAQLEIDSLLVVGLSGLTYILCRITGKISGAWLGGKLVRADTFTCNWMGIALLPQAGVALGMALVAGNAFPENRQIILSIMISTTVFFELLGPIITRIALEKSVTGEIR